MKRCAPFLLVLGLLLLVPTVSAISYCTVQPQNMHFPNMSEPYEVGQEITFRWNWSEKTNNGAEMELIYNDEDENPNAWYGAFSHFTGKRVLCKANELTFNLPTEPGNYKYGFRNRVSGSNYGAVFHPLDRYSHFSVFPKFNWFGLMETFYTKEEVDALVEDAPCNCDLSGYIKRSEVQDMISDAVISLTQNASAEAVTRADVLSIITEGENWDLVTTMREYGDEIGKLNRRVSRWRRLKGEATTRYERNKYQRKIDGATERISFYEGEMIRYNDEIDWGEVYAPS